MRRNVLAVFIIIGLFLFSVYSVVAPLDFQIGAVTAFNPNNGSILSGNNSALGVNNQSIFFNFSLLSDPAANLPLLASNHTHALFANYSLYNGTTVFLTTQRNLSANQSIWNLTFRIANASFLSEGLYNFTINITNLSNIMTNFTINNLTIDRLKPNLTESFVNITDGVRTLTSTGFPGLNGTDYLTNVTLTIRGRVEDTSGQVVIIFRTNGTVNISARELDTYPNALNYTSNVSVLHTLAETKVTTNYINQLSGTGQATFNGTIAPQAHGANISFAVWANDSATGLANTDLWLNYRTINHSVGFNLTVDGIRPQAKITISEGGTALDDNDAVTRGVTVKVECQDQSTDNLPAHSFNITVDRPGSEGDSSQQTNSRAAANSVQVLNFNTAGDGESNGEFTARCNVQDVGGSSSITKRFTVQSSGGTSGGAGGGSGGGGAGAP